MQKIPQSLYDLRQTQLQLEAEAKQLREQGRIALALSVAVEARQAQEKFARSALAYRKLGFMTFTGESEHE